MTARPAWSLADSYRFFVAYSTRVRPAGSCRHFSKYYTAPAVTKRAGVRPGTTPPRLRVSLDSTPTYLGHFSSRGNRLENEDRYDLSVLTLPARSSLAPRSQSGPATRSVFSFGVFDGHGGAQCSDFLDADLVRYVEDCDLHSADALEALWRDNIGGYWKRWKGQFEKYRAQIGLDNDLALRLPLAFLKADYDFTMTGTASGSTCTTVYLWSEDPDQPYWAPHPAKLVVSHVGDTRCVLCDRDGVAHALTVAHHPSSPVESRRLRRYASNFFTDSFGEERYGSFANTRSFGDRRMKQLGVSAEPDITEVDLGNPKSDRGFGGNEPFLVLMSDGVSGFASDQEIVDVATSVGYNSGFMRGTPQDAAREIVKYAEAVGGDDNATCIVVRLAGWGQWNKPLDRTGDIREYRIKNALDKRRQ
ncbi:phosphatase 2C-like domain-containing protein [Dipodascopsis tothii]|uniref:phosphatase 2C-like domain-containing protein n=1 Tax=Dipodascopsis tothii TaxID=44089 RepID=UPI0034CDF38B